MKGYIDFKTTIGTMRCGPQEIIGVFTDGGWRTRQRPARTATAGDYIMVGGRVGKIERIIEVVCND